MRQPRSTGLMRVLALMGGAAEALPLTVQKSIGGLDLAGLAGRAEPSVPSVPSTEGPGTPSTPSTRARGTRPFSEPINVAFVTMGIFCGILVVGWGVYKAYRRWAHGRRFDPNERLWPPVTAGAEEITQLVELIRIGMIDSHGAPPHVVNWIVHGVNAVWPPLEGIESLTRRRRRRRNRALGIVHSRARSAPERAEHEARRAARRRARAAAAAAAAAAAREHEPDYLPPYVCNPAQDSNHHPPPEFPMSEVSRAPPPQFSAGYGAPLGMAESHTGTGITSAGSSRPVSGASDIAEEEHDIHLSGLSPRPLPAHIR